MNLYFFSIILVSIFSQRNDILILHPVIGNEVNKSISGEIKYLEKIEECESFWNDYHKKYGKGFIDKTKMSNDEKITFDKCAEDIEPYWGILGIGCSWYCGGGQYSVTASSELNPNGSINYSHKNAHDLSYKTAWVEGVKGYGIGEYLTYHVQPTNPRITEIIIVNGYVKSDKAWRENSRVKKLKLYIDNKPYAVLNLKDIKSNQHFKVEPLGTSKRDNSEEMKKLPIWEMKFEIIEVYNGDKYDDTAISEIYFDGIDVH